MSRERLRQEHGPDFMYFVPKGDVVTLELVDLLAKRGYAVVLVEKESQRNLVLNASSEAKQVINNVILTAEFEVLSMAFRGSGSGDVLEKLALCDWEVDVRKGVFAEYEYQKLLKLGFSEEEAERSAREISQKRITSEEIPALLSHVIDRADAEVQAEKVFSSKDWF